MSRKSIVLSLLMVLVLTALAACSSGKGKPLESGDITKENVSQVCEILNEAGLSNVDVFEKWVKDSASGASEKASEMSGFTDADCRMTVMLLAGELIKYDSVEEDYNGTYLMFDMDAIENKDEYSILKEKKQLFTTMFGEMAISKNGFAETLPENWSKHGINVESDKCSVISILFKAYEEEAAFVGHTGILIDCRNIESVDSNYLFVEKIAFGDPFKITLFKDENDLIEMLSERPDYTSEEGDPAPVVYKNGERMPEARIGNTNISIEEAGKHYVRCMQRRSVSASWLYSGKMKERSLMTSGQIFRVLFADGMMKQQFIVMENG